MFIRDIHHKANMDDTYHQKQTWTYKTMRKLLQEAATSTEASSSGPDDMTIAWIAAVVVNVIILIAFIVGIIYCYRRRKRQREMLTRSATLSRQYRGRPDTMMFANKAENGLPKEKLMGDGGHPRAIFTVEHGRRSHTPGDRCDCASPRCYCSMGDGRKTTDQQSLENEEEEDPKGYPTPSPTPRFPTPQQTPEPEDYWRPDSEDQTEEEEEDMDLPGNIPEPEPEMPPEQRYFVYSTTDGEGSRDYVGQLVLPTEMYLNDVRHALVRNGHFADIIKGRKFRFVNEEMDEVPSYQESSLDLERMYPTLIIYIQYQKPKKEEVKSQPPSPTRARVPKKPKMPAYVGPLGVCNGPDCTKAGKIKCLDCRNVAYCNKTCMREDQKDHKRTCYKPVWRI